MRIKQEDTLALIIDYQEKLVPVMKNKEQLIKNSMILIKGLKVLGIPMIITEQYKKGLGETVKEIKEAAIEEELEEVREEVRKEVLDVPRFESPAILDKISFSCADNEEILENIKSFGKKNIILCGIEAHICVLQTAIDLKELGYQVILVTDCIDSRKPIDKKIALKRAVFENIMLTTYEAILFELTRKAGNDTFKIISKLIK